MTQISLNHEGDSVKQFILSLPIDSEGVALELAGQVICKVVAANGGGTDATLIERGRSLVQKARQRNNIISTDTIEHVVDSAVAEVRRRCSE